MSHIAICCQGGGSHTAFTGGALGPLLTHARKIARRVTVTGTSGGALCAAVATTAADPERALKRLWDDVKAASPSDAWLNFMTTSAAYLLPLLSPYVNPLQPARTLRHLIEKHIRGTPQGCLIGTCNVLSGEFTVFCDEEIGIDQLMASCTMPYIFPATEIDGDYFWDGIFSQNPPVADLFGLDEKPDELWVIRIDPKTRAKVPISANDIDDRSKELAYANALEHELKSIERINRWLAAGVNLPGYQPVTIRQITLDLDLDNGSKLDRRPALIDDLFARGHEAAQSFITHLNSQE